MAHQADERLPQQRPRFAHPAVGSIFRHMCFLRFEWLSGGCGDKGGGGARVECVGKKRRALERIAFKKSLQKNEHLFGDVSIFPQKKQTMTIAPPHQFYYNRKGIE
ncbi:MAG: hypothetical protein HDT27_10100 [Subdoligranulum sp.]|nr:hypothetical protein [Subdoligranulum sp.]MBD5103015.1 hypothetical protein [Subdoligranulum sp.]